MGKFGLILIVITATAATILSLFGFVWQSGVALVCISLCVTLGFRVFEARYVIDRSCPVCASLYQSLLPQLSAQIQTTNSETQESLNLLTQHFRSQAHIVQNARVEAGSEALDKLLALNEEILVLLQSGDRDAQRLTGISEALTLICERIEQHQQREESWNSSELSNAITEIAKRTRIEPSTHSREEVSGVTFFNER